MKPLEAAGVASGRFPGLAKSWAPSPRRSRRIGVGSRPMLYSRQGGTLGRARVAAVRLREGSRLHRGNRKRWKGLR